MNPLKNCFALLIFSFIFFSCDFNEYPPQVLDQEFDIEEFSPNGTVVGIIEAHDKDEGQVISFEILQASDEGIFEINPSDGSIVVVDSEKLDYEHTKQVRLIVSVSDDHKRFGEETTAEVLINVVEFKLGVPENGLLAYYPFNGNANDKSGNQIHGEVHGAQITSDRFGNPARAYLFDGLDDVIWYKNPHPFHFGDKDFTITAWIEIGTQAPRDPGSIFSVYHSNGDREFVMGVHPNVDSVFLKIYPEGEFGPGDIVWADMPMGWHMFTVTRSSSHLRMYKDGMLKDEVPVTTSLETGNAAAMIGALHFSSHSPDNFYNGKIDDVSVYNRVLEEDEIRALYQGEDLLLK